MKRIKIILILLISCKKFNRYNISNKQDNFCLKIVYKNYGLL